MFRRCSPVQITKCSQHFVTWTRSLLNDDKKDWSSRSFLSFFLRSGGGKETHLGLRNKPFCARGRAEPFMVMNDNYEAIDPLRRHKYVWGSSRRLGDVFSEETNQDKIRTKGTFTLISIRSLHCKWHTQKKSRKKRIEQTQACVVSPSAVNLTDTIGAVIHITPPLAHLTRALWRLWK